MMGALGITQLFCCNAKAATDNSSMNGCGCVPIQPFIWAMKPEFHTIYTSFDFPQLFKMQKVFLAHGIWSMVCSLLTPAFNKHYFNTPPILSGFEETDPFRISLSLLSVKYSQAKLLFEIPQVTTT